METKVRTLAREILSGLQNAEDSQSIITWLAAARALCSQSGDDGSLHSLLSGNLVSHQDIPHQQLKEVYQQQHYHKLCCTILDKLSVEWVQKLAGSAFTDYVVAIFLTGPAADSLLALDHALQTHNRQGFKLHKTTSLLELFIKKGRLFHVLWDQCQLLGFSVDEQAERQTSGTSGVWEELIQTLAALPTKMANILGRENSDTFLPQNYVPWFALYITECLQKTHDLIMDFKDCSLEFISRLVGKFCRTGYADLLLDSLLPPLCAEVTKDYVWCRMCERVITGVPQLAMESVIVPVLTKIPWYGLVDKFLGDCVVHNHKVRFLLCTTLLFHRFFSKVLLLQNLIGYLASSHTRRQLYHEVFCNLLRVWGDASSLHHISSEQHLFLCRALMICISHVGLKEQQEWKDELIRLLLPGVQSHLGSTVAAVRTRGMLVAQVLTRTVDPKGQQIEFEMVRTEEVEELEKLLEVPSDPGMPTLEQHLERVRLREAQEEKSADSSEQQPPPGTDSDLDSDDDLVPYDMSNDKKVSKVKAPKYIRDCMEGLINTQEADKFEACLTAAESLIRSRPDGLPEISQEFTKILLHSTESCGIPGFAFYRLGAMTALAVQCPQLVAKYLTGEFYERNYNIRQRLDMLEVLAAASQELSQPDKAAPDHGDERKSSTDLAPHNTQPETWREIVQRRIDSKTRRFGKGPSKPEAPATPNRFGNVAGEFFYPLMRFYDRGERAFDLLGDDSLVLHRLVYTLAIILHAAMHTPAARQMGKTLLEFTWSLRLHPDVSVRQAVLVATSMAVLVIPPHFLLTDLQTDMLETKAWLEGVFEHDVNVECKKLAAQGLGLLDSIVAKVRVITGTCSVLGTVTPRVYVTNSHFLFQLEARVKWSVWEIEWKWEKST
ncbi:hypothetical protein BaRGS_00001532 [Batillaria attramentaria]|uniref:Telomere length regulation protein TEL2 homolog n=1 Tax=Batillaria attramentaria TaxID=370345 RepID=A0ABD0M8A5_9CAEN